MSETELAVNDSELGLVDKTRETLALRKKLGNLLEQFVIELSPLPGPKEDG